MEQTESKLFKSIKLGDSQKREEITETITNSTRLLSAPKEYRALRKELGWNEVEKQAEAKLEVNASEAQIRDKYPNQIIYSQEDLLEFCVKNNYSVVNIKDYKYKTPDALLVILDEYIKENKINNVDHFSILYPNHLNNNPTKEEILKNRDASNTEEIIIVYRLIESTNIHKNFFSVLNTLGNVKDKRNFITKFFSDNKAINYVQQCRRNVLQILFMILAAISAIGYGNFSGEFALTNYKFIFITTCLFLVPLVIHLLSNKFKSIKDYLEVDRVRKYPLENLVNSLFYYDHQFMKESTVKYLKLKESKYLIIVYLLIASWFVVYNISMVEGYYTRNSTKTNSWVIYDKDRVYEVITGENNDKYLYTTYSVLKRDGFMDYKQFQFTSKNLTIK